MQNTIVSPATGQDKPIAKSIEPTQASVFDNSDDFQVSQKCSEGVLDEKTCKFRWGPALGQLGEYLGIETGWNLATNYWVRRLIFHGHFVQDYFQAVEFFSFSRWDDDNPVYDDYLGHPMMSAIAMDNLHSERSAPKVARTPEHKSILAQQAPGAFMVCDL